jgi:hypothetical protein
MKRILIIIGLMAVLVGGAWMAQTYSSWRVAARTARMSDEMQNLFDALQKYKEHVGTYPIGSNADIAKALKGQNAKNVIILVGASRKSESNEKGEFVDPWGTPLQIFFSDRTILIRSAGPNRRFDDTTVSDFDDLIRAN